MKKHVRLQNTWLSRFTLYFPHNTCFNITLMIWCEGGTRHLDLSSGKLRDKYSYLNLKSNAWWYSETECNNSDIYFLIHFSPHDIQKDVGHPYSKSSRVLPSLFLNTLWTSTSLHFINSFLTPSYQQGLLYICVLRIALQLVILKP